MKPSLPKIVIELGVGKASRKAKNQSLGVLPLKRSTSGK
jgi:hypothetical protein